MGQWILGILIATIIGCLIGYFLLRASTKIRIFLFRKRSNRYKKEEVSEFHAIRFYNTFNFYYEDVIKYAPELDAYMSSILPSDLKDKITFKMIKMYEIYDAIRIIEEIDIIKFNQALENIKTQKALENIE